jgi:hypothetical protein
MKNEKCEDLPGCMTLVRAERQFGQFFIFHSSFFIPSERFNNRVRVVNAPAPHSAADVL